jgi:hypothetical protein
MWKRPPRVPKMASDRHYFESVVHPCTVSVGVKVTYALSHFQTKAKLRFGHVAAACLGCEIDWLLLKAPEHSPEPYLLPHHIFSELPLVFNAL